MKFKWSQLVITLLIIIAVLISGGLGFFTYMVFSMEELPDSQQAQTSRFYYHDGELMTTQFVENRTKVPLEEISEQVVWATVAVEDSDFYSHSGFDFTGIARAAYQNLRERRITQGGSTITQQLAKNLYLNHDRTWDRKLEEAAIAINLERKFSKDEIMEKYLNTIYYGHSTYGIEAASQLYFDKPADELNTAEAAMLAGIPRGPGYYSPFINEESAYNRQRIILKLMEEEGFISPSELEQALNEELELNEEFALPRESNYVVEQIMNQELDEITEDDPETIQKGGFDFHTTIDPHMQEVAERILDEELPETSKDEEGTKQPQGALVALEPDTGKIRALVGGRDYQETMLNRVNISRSPGSAFKPLVYAAALEQDYTIADTFLCEPISLQEEGMDEPYEPTDFDGGFHDENLTLRRALAESCNITAVKLNQKIGRDAAAEMADRLGVESSIGNHLSTPLGSSEVNLLELTAAYAPFANGGYRIEPVILNQATDHNNEELINNSAEKEKVIDEGIAYLMTDMMKDALEPGGTAERVSQILERPGAGKTGTSQGFRDAYMVGYTPDLVVGIYIGNDQEEPLQGTGGSLAAPIWAKFVEEASHAIPPKDFTRPDNVVTETICQETGLIQSEYCTADSEKELFIEGTAPAEDCSYQDCPYIEEPNWWEWDFWF
ncbi:transglycosylase domain-containing protein [Natranaerobius thermophilus]|uniref:Penicillin-binding protein 1A n=1 Tax=Natranaerobius thermophilus (strain ATCC BAA-1301 / DSM 18059 / JW/NM-WN-LF) TaxID=457570 RepID=B2A7D5_NATTJ|nr:PBP1A family penicillin-binding protein [Natranaerobius thermophilus]ACB84329.1 penicillin-binding protein, 1A family [Natranaerobius thermophilus JW/NM-WN-LF]